MLPHLGLMGFQIFVLQLKVSSPTHVLLKDLGDQEVRVPKGRTQGLGFPLFTSLWDTQALEVCCCSLVGTTGPSNYGKSLTSLTLVSGETKENCCREGKTARFEG